MFDSLVATLALILNFVMSARTVRLNAKRGCKLLTKCYYELEQLVIVSEWSVNMLDNLPMGRRTRWPDFLDNFQKQLGVLNKRLEAFLDAYEKVDNAFSIHTPELAKFTARLINTKKAIYKRTFANWFDEGSLTSDEQKLRLRILKMSDKIDQRMHQEDLRSKVKRLTNELRTNFESAFRVKGASN